MCADLAYHVDTAAVVQDGLDGLSSFRMVWKPRLRLAQPADSGQ